MSNLTTLQELLAKDSFFRQLFAGASDIQAAIKVAKLYGIHLSQDDVSSIRAELPHRREPLITIPPQPSPQATWGGGNEDIGDRGQAWGSGHCSDFGAGCHD
jgi:hypothetical protein